MKPSHGLARPRTSLAAAVRLVALAACDSVSAPTKPLALTHLSAGDNHTCGIAAADTTYCWGYNGFGELGDGTTHSSTNPVTVYGGITFTLVSAGGAETIGGHTCGVTPSGAAYCWGNNAHGQLGNGTTASSTTPRAVSGHISFAAVSVGGTHTCGTSLTGAVYCWGYNVYGELGDSTTTDAAAPVPVYGGLTFATVSAGDLHTCALTPAGVAYCWGFNLDGQLGDGTLNDSRAPVAVSGGLTFVAISAGGSHTCGITDIGAASCWGNNGYGELGSGTTTYSYRTSPVPVAGGITFTALSSGGYHSCGVASTGATFCWGYNADGQLGNGTTSNDSMPAPVSGALTFAAVSTGFFHTCAMTIVGATFCWGENLYGELGNGTTRPYSSAPVPVSR